MQYSTVALCLLAGAVKQGLAGYTLTDDYAASNFFNMFSFFDSSDPTHGYVQYLDQPTAQADGLVKTVGDSVYMGVDSTNVASGAGRNSVRLTSNKAYDHGLVILDAAHMPEGCGTWPAFWMVGANWPNQGEIDIIEGVNEQIGNAMTLHTGPGCAIDNAGFTGTLTTPNCYVNAPGQGNNQGCGIANSASNSYGSGFNANNGGVYATEWTSLGISVWFFPRGSIPGDVAGGNPNPAGWGTPVAHYSGACDIDSSFKNLQIVFDTTFCGDWAGGVWGSGSCASKASSCQAFVQNNPSAFANAYWSINSLRVYQDNGVVGNSAQPTVGGPTGVPDSSLVSVAPIPTASDSIPFSQTASFWNGEGWDSAPAPTAAAAAAAAAPAASASKSGAATAVAPASPTATSAAPSVVATTFATATAAAPASSKQSAAPVFWDGQGWADAPIPSSSINAATTSAAPVFWDGQGWADAPTPTPTAAPPPVSHHHHHNNNGEHAVAVSAAPAAPSPSVLLWEGGDLPPRRRHARHLHMHNRRVLGAQLS